MHPKSGAFSLTSTALRTLSNTLIGVLAFGAAVASGADPMTSDIPLSEPAAVTAAPARDGISDSVGATMAQFRVDEGGNATYSVPIQIPAGTAGVSPRLSLSYNSRLGVGSMGPGWVIEGTSQVTRCRQTRESGDFMSGTTPVDGNPLPINFTSTDRFCLDGVRLLVVVGSYGANNSVYRPESDPTTKVTATVSSATAGPDVFVVQRKDGTISRYGDVNVSSASRATAIVNGATAYLSWSVSRTQDTVGNYVDFFYQNQPSGSFYPFSAGAVEFVLSQVKYTGNVNVANAVPYASVSFSYANLPAANVRLGYQSGVTFLQSQQLSSVTVQDNIDSSPRVLRFYKLGYSGSISGSGVQQLRQIQECRDNSLAVCFPPTLFGWSAANYSFVNDTSQTHSAPDFTNLAGYKVGDIDGDGRQDIVWAKSGDSSCSGNSRLYVSFLDRTTSNQMTLVAPTQAVVCAPINLLNNDAAWLLLDYDGDGRLDLLIGGAAGSHWAVYLSAGRPAGGQRVFGSTDKLAGLTTPITVPAGINAAGALVDVNGDGLPDFLYAGTAVFDGYSVILGRLMTRQNGVLSFSEPYSVKLNHMDDVCTGPLGVHCYVNFFSHDAGHRSAIPTDINGDGRGDLTVAVDATSVCNPTCPRPSANDTLFDPSIGKDVASPDTGDTHYYWYQFVADGITTPVGAPSPIINFKQYWSREMGVSGGDMPDSSDKVYVADVNGDGLTDILYQDRTSSTTYWALINTGNGYQGGISVSGITSNGASPPIQLADINGDGRMDVVYFTSNTTSSYVSFAPSTASNWTFTAPTVVPGGGIHTSQPWISLLGDFDGDGAPDFLMLQVQATTGNLYASRAAAASRYHPRDVITSFTNGLGAVTTLTYQPLTNKAIYQRGIDGEMPSLTQHNFGYGSPVFDVLAPIYVVSQASSSAPLKSSASAVSSVYYRYQAALMQSGGRGFLGFWQTQAFDANDQASTNGYIVSTNGYGQSYPFIGTPLVSITFKFSGVLTRGSVELDTCAGNPETLSYNCFSPIDTGPNPVRWPSLLDRGVWVQYTGQQPYCNGSGCIAPTADAIATCTTASSSAAPPEISSNFLDGLFVPPATAGPILSYTLHSNSLQYDPDAGSPGQANAVTTTGSDTYTCYEDSWANATHVHTVTRDGNGALVAQKLVANTYTNDTANWFLGRLTNSTVKFMRPGLSTITRTSDFTYNALTGLLTSERVQKGLGADQDLRTMYALNSFGSRTAAYQCSSDLTDVACIAVSGFPQQPLDATGHSNTLVHRYAKTTYDGRGRYVTGSRLPFYSTTATNHLSEQTAVAVNERDEFGNATLQSSINGLVQTTLAGALGRPYYASDNTGKSSTTTYRLCTAVSCPGDAKFRSQTITAGMPSTWTYYDLLGRPILKVGRSFDLNASTQQFSGGCSYYDGHNRPTYVSEPFFVPATVAADGSPALSSATPCNSAFYATTTQYDGVGRFKKATHPDNGTVQVSHVGLHTFTTNPRGFTWEGVVNALGEVTQTLDPDVPSDSADNLIVNQAYDAAGNVVSITRDAGSGSITNTATYDALGRKRSLSDPDSGTTSFSYNAAGEVVKQIDAKVQAIQNDYDALGRLWRRTAPGADGNTITDTWTFDTSANGFGQIGNEARSATTSLAYGRGTYYDAYGRLSQRNTSIAGSTYLEVNAYDAFDRPLSRKDAAGYTTTSAYTTVGYLQSLIDDRVGTVYQVLAMTARGQVQQDRRGGTANLFSSMAYSPITGRLSNVCAGPSCALQDLTYGFDLAGNLTERRQAASAAPSVEQASYDALNRLKTGQITTSQGVVQNPPITTTSMVYDKLGNLCSNNGIAYTYAGRAGCPNHGSAGSPHAVTNQGGGGTYTYDADGNLEGGTSGRTFSWNALNQATKIASGTIATTFDYAPDGSRFRRIDNGVQTTYTIGAVEIVKVPGSTEYRRYLGGVAIDYVRSNGNNETRYVFNDHLGSPSVFAGPTGTQIEAQSFSAFGNRRNPVTWFGVGTVPTSTTHGFTGHEQIDALHVTHMNGRLYDPRMGRMLQPDPFSDGSSQGLNRYSYVINNPLSLTDPTGYSWLSHFLDNATGFLAMGPLVYSAFHNEWNSAVTNPYVRMAGAIVAGYFTFGASYAALGEGFWAGAGAGAAAGFVSGAIQSNGSFQGALQGAFSGALFGGIGGYYGNTYSAAHIAAEGLAGGVVSSLEGGSFGNGFLSAGASAALMPLAGKPHYVAEKITVAAIIGGTVSAISGGKFANGAASAAFQVSVAEGSRAVASERAISKPALIFGQYTDAMAAAWQEYGDQVVNDLASYGYYFSEGIEISVVVNTDTFGKDVANFDGEKIVVDQSAMTSGSWSSGQLAAFLGHELVHYIDYSNSLYALSNSPSTYPGRAASEIRAYGWNLNFSGNYGMQDQFFTDQFTKFIQTYSVCTSGAGCESSLFK